jgi:hypothetical protein
MGRASPHPPLRHVVWQHAFYDYYREVFHPLAFSRNISHQAVEHDTAHTILRRFLIGAVAGSVLGILTHIRSRQKS